ncbi:MAG: SDR family oxidoreductase [Nitrosomonas sp.]|nr:SDR family oxidoreductase [Nitrosomonas sp.]
MNKKPSTVLITGANRGIGLEFATQYAADNWRIIACCRQPDRAESLQALKNIHGDRLLIYKLDVSDFMAVDQLAGTLCHESIDIIINNAGVYPPTQQGEFGHIDYDAWLTTLRINTLAPLKMAEAFVTQLERSQLKMVAILTSKMGSIADNERGGSYPYRTSKTAVNMVAKSLAIDLAPQHITTILLHPGWVQTRMGGPSALISTQQSVAGMRNVLNRTLPTDSGKFFAYDGQLIPW